MATHDDMLHLVGRFYDCAVDPDGWESALEGLGDLFGKASVFLGDFDQTKGLGAAHSARVDHSNVTAEVLQICFTPEDMPLLRLAQQLPSVSPINSSAIIDRKTFLRTNTYRHLLRPAKLRHGLLAEIHREGGSFCGLGIHRPDGLADFDRRDHLRLGALLPHLSHALKVRHRIKSLRAERDAALDALDRLPIGVVLAGADARVIAMNAAAEEIVRMTDGLGVSTGELRAARQDETAALIGLISRAAATSAGQGLDPGGAMALSRPSMLRPLSILVAPLRAEVLEAGPMRRIAIVFVADPEAESETPECTLVRLYGLTPAEARLAALLIQGHGLEGAAEILEVSINTVRTHGKNLFEKTGVRRQAELVRLVLTGPAALRPIEKEAGDGGPR